MVCKNCGINVKNCRKYCKKCGANVKTGLIPSAYPMEIAVKKQKKHRIIKIAVIATLVIVAVISMLIWHMQR